MDLTMVSKYPIASIILVGCYANLGMNDESLRALEMGAGCGMYGYDYLKILPILDPIRDLPEFQAIMTDLKAETDQMRKRVLAKEYFDQ